ncbi:MAG: glycosyltransferase family 4 protein [Candidatus Helarchaeota archaeon]|nr:glycosyltransferase family 4 protein [Candidatus Helarchaeota archaeon]
MGYKVCYMMKRYLTPFIEGYTIGSKNLIKATRLAGVNATVLSAEPGSCQIEESATYVFRTLFAEKFHVDNLVTASYASFLSSLNDYDVIHFLPNLPGDVYASFIRLKLRKETRIIAHFAHPYHPFIHSPFSRFRLSFLCKKVLDYVFCTTNFLVEYFRQNTGIQESRIFCVPLPVDTDKYKPLPQKGKLREKHGISGEHIIAFVGQIEPVRGVFELLRAFYKVVKHIDNVQLVISSPRLAYERPYISAFQKIVRKLKLEDKVVSLGPQHRLEEIYNLADIVAFPYTQPYYYMDPPLTLFEAMASGALIIASDVGAVSELVVNGKNGKLIKPRNIEALFDAIVDCIRNVDNYRFLGVKARETVMTKFSMNRIGFTLAKLYSKILEDMPR